MNKTDKTEIISQIKDLVGGSDAVYLVNYTGVSVEEISTIRREFLKEGITYKVFKNTLVKKALQQTEGYEKFNDLLVGMIGYAFAKDNTTVPAKIIKQFNDKNNKFNLVGCYIEDQFFSGDQLEALSKLPTKLELIAGIIGSINAPASGIVGAINAVARDLVSVLDAIEKKKAA
jgi:large subunit ribosomal protein L10